MAVEDVRALLRSQLEENYGVDGAAYLVYRPPGGWSDLVTHRDIDALEARMTAQFAEVTTGIDHRFVDVNCRFTDLETNIDRRFTEVDRRFTALHTNFDIKLGALEDRLTSAMNTGFKEQTRWFVTTVLAIMTILATVMVLAVKL